MASAANVAGAVTFDDILTQPGRPTGFNFLRLALATAVLASHTIDVSYGLRYAIDLENGPFRPLMALLVPMFFALSGFLVGGSLDRSRTLVTFTGLRVIRLMPALAVETALAAVLLGPLLTTLPLVDYVQHPYFLGYFRNIFAHTQYLLPGLFANNPWPETVNAQLWTLPFEIASYATLIGLALFGIHRKPLLFVAIVVTINAVLIARYFAAGVLNANSVVNGSILIMCFLFGFTLHLLRREVRHSRRVAFAAGGISVALLSSPITEVFAAPFVAYLTVYVGLLRPTANILISRGDYSYGIYVYGFPVQQAVTQLTGPSGHHWYVNLLIALPLTVILAALSWHWVEEPSLRLRDRIVSFEDDWLRLKTSLNTGALRDKLARL